MSGALAFFGAFNPPTVAHLELARFALEQTGRERAIFVPSKSVYIRGEQGKDFAYPDARRLEMLRAAAASRPWMAVTDWEMRQKAQPRTYETLCHLRSLGDAPALLMGSDKLPELEHGWRHVDEIAREFGILCMTRGGDDCARMLAEDPYLRALSPWITLLETPAELRGISSTQVRRRVAAGEPAEGLVPEEILPLLPIDLPGA